MQFRLRMFRLHLVASASVLTFVLGLLYLGWYHWPGWYLAAVARVVVVMAGVDVALGPLLTLVVSDPGKERRTLARDLTVIVAMQLLALVYGSAQLWSGRPLYYVFSGGILQIVQAYDLDRSDTALAQQRQLELAPHWYSLPRWVYAPTPAPAPAPTAAVAAADYSVMPSGYQAWERGIGELREKLQPVESLGFFIFNERASLQARMRAAGLHPEQRNAVPMTGRGRPVLVVFEPETMRTVAILKAL